MTQASLWKILCLVREHNPAFFALLAIMLLAGNLTEITLPYDEALAFLAYKLYPRNAGLQRLLISRAPGSTIITASQKGIGCPAGLSIMMVSGRAMERFKARKTRPTSYFGSWKNWLPSKCPCAVYPKEDGQV